MSEVETSLSSEEVLKLLGGMQTAVEATTSSATPLLTKIRNDDPSLETSNGLSLLLLRPQLLLQSLHNLVILLSLRLASSTNHIATPVDSTAVTTSFSAHQRDRTELEGVEDFLDELSGDLTLSQEVFDKVRGMEGKLEYQIKKLIGLADAEEKRGREVIDDAEEDPLSFRPNPAAFASASSSKKTSSARPARDDDSSKDVYRPPRIAAVPYEEPSSSRRDRRAPALLSEFAHTMDGAPVLESTTGLSVRPVQKDRHTNSLSAKRAAELERMDKFEEENMTRLVTTKREEKRRREDEAALSMGYGVGGTGRGKGRRQNGLEAELEGVLGDRRSKGLWEGVKKDLGQRESVLERGKKRGSAPTEVRNKKARFDKDVKGHAKKAKRT